MDKITFDDLVKAFGSPTRAAEWMGVTRQSIYNWRDAGEVPDPYCYKALYKMKEAKGHKIKYKVAS